MRPRERGFKANAKPCDSANDLKTGGIGAITRALEHGREVDLSVRGELRECELEIALQEVHADLTAGRVVHESVDDHLRRLDTLALGPEDELHKAQMQP